MIKKILITNGNRLVSSSNNVRVKLDKGIGLRISDITNNYF